MKEALTNRSGTRRILRLTIQWLVPIVILVAFLISGQLGAALSTLGDVSLLLATPLVVIGTALPVSHAWRWCYLLRRTGEALPVAASTRITALSSLINYAAPGFLGAPAKAIFARDGYRVPISRSLPTLAMEQVLDALMLLVFGALAILLTGPVLIDAVPATFSLGGMLWIIGAVFVVSTAAVFALIVARKVMPAFVDALRSASVDLMSTRDWLRPIGALTLTRWILDMAAIGIASVAVGLRLSVVEILLIANLSLLVGLIAPVPGGLGVREAVMVGIAGAIGIAIPAVLALSVLHRAGLAIGLPFAFVIARLSEREWR